MWCLTEAHLFIALLATCNTFSSSLTCTFLLHSTVTMMLTAAAAGNADIQSSRGVLIGLRQSVRCYYCTKKKKKKKTSCTKAQSYQRNAS